MVALLLHYKANPNISDINGYTPILLAAERGHLDIIRYLLEEKAELYTKVIYSLRASNLYPWHNLPLCAMALTRGFPTRWQQKDDLETIEDPYIQTQSKSLRTHIEQEVLRCFPDNWFNTPHTSELLTYVPDILRLFPQVINTIQTAEALLAQNSLLTKEKWSHIPYPGLSVKTLELLWATRPMDDSNYQKFCKHYGREPQRKPLCKLPNEIFMMIHQQLLAMALIKCLWEAIKEERQYIRICATIVAEPTYFEKDKEVLLNLESAQPGDYELFKKLGARLSKRYGVL